MTRSTTDSERGIALVVVLLLLAVMSGLVTGFAMNGQVEVAMGNNEVYYAGARAAAEAGLNRALAEVLSSSNSTINFFWGPDQLPDTADNGVIGQLGGLGPFTVDSAGEYSYTVHIYDDDDPALYGLASMDDVPMPLNENNNPFLDGNQTMVLQATGYGPSGTTVKMARLITNTASQETSTSLVPSLSNPAILVNGNLDISGSVVVAGASGNVHANGNMVISGNPSFSRDVTSSGSFKPKGSPSFGGAHSGYRAAINVPNFTAEQYEYLGTIKLAAGGQIQARNGSGTWVQCTVANVGATAAAACSASGWSYHSGTSTWSLAGNSTSPGTYYVEGAVSISGNHSNSDGTNMAFSVIATGSITVSGNQKFTPENTELIQFLTNKDFTMSGNLGFDDPTVVEGQILVREQISSSGNTQFQGRVWVKNVTSTTGFTTNTISGNPTFTYDANNFDPITTMVTSTTVTDVYTTNLAGWMELW